MRGTLVLLAMLVGAVAAANQIVVIPVDNRPAAIQFPQMIARIASEDVLVPPLKALGKFTTPGSPDQIIQWLRGQDLSQVDALVISADMLAYGGLVASRQNEVSADTAIARLHVLGEIHRHYVNLPIYVFSATMRLVPTATKLQDKWRMHLARYEEIQDSIKRLHQTRYAREAETLKLQIPKGEIEKYEKTRVRNHLVQRELVQMVASHDIEYLMVGEDDSRIHGPQIVETADLQVEVKRLNVEGRAYFSEGIDQHSSVLLSRALLKKADWVPRVRVVYSGTDLHSVANYESQPLDEGVRAQIVASGGRLARLDEDYDYALYVNTPKRTEDQFQRWLDKVKEELDLNLPVAMADVNLGEEGTTDSEVYNALANQKRLVKLISFAGWNTAGNSLGTAVPAANVYLLAKKLNTDPMRRELSQREFLLHRLVDDHAFHTFTRPIAYGMVMSPSRNEIYGEDFHDINDFVQRDMEKQIDHAFDLEFKGASFSVGSDSFQLSAVRDVRVWLPWPRAYEVGVEFRIEAKLAGEK